MGSLVFPDVSYADKDGFIGISEDFTAEDLLEAYQRGIFPWPWTSQYVGWFAPPLRSILEFAAYRPSSSFEKFIRRTEFTIKHDHNFEEVIVECARSKNRKKQSGTWITDHIIGGYTKLNRLGFAHSFEVYDCDELVGGVYGVSLGGYFSAESMFYKRPNASKLALHALISFLKPQGLTWIDCQVASPFTTSLGAQEISREKFMELLGEALKQPQTKW